ncbi:hypothetical protein ACFOOK_25660 [Micromonospora krabiensis]|uniref:Uncharacterized protein n=1 Tax=Micromonospora krabiensis TaxID=307121 RepID=A0A1C3N651_9ACTN|nr:hypothetical protein [Micromonospora krabiensis]SBV28048.1 hypothetical protein GA0070620_3580 [Micromonospora krabiensis]
MIPEEDHPASRPSGYAGIEADIRQLREFADLLTAEVERDYAPHLPHIAEDMTAPLPNPCDAFIELVHFLRAHHETQQATVEMVWGARGVTGHLAAAAGTVADRYAGTDAFTAARVVDVEQALADPRSVVPAGPSVALHDPTGPTDGPVILP